MVTTSPPGAKFYVTLVSGQAVEVMVQDEVDWFNQTKAQYLDQTKFTERTDLADLDRLLVHELMIFRWTVWIFRGSDYVGDMIDEERLRRNIKEYCLDEATEIMTSAGWRTFDQIVPGQHVLTLNTETGMSEWQPMDRIFVEPRKTEMVSMESRNHSSLSTLGHRWWSIENGVGRWRTSEDLNTASCIPIAAELGTPPVEQKYLDDLVELVGWFWTEGSVDLRDEVIVGGELSQSGKVNAGNVERIRGVLRRLFGAPGRMGWGEKPPHWNETVRGDGQVLFNLSVFVMRVLWELAPNRVLAPEFVHALTRSQLRLLIDVSVAADGWVTKRGSVRLAQRSEERVRAFEMACALAGIATTTKLNSIGMWECGLLGRRQVRPVGAASRGTGATVKRVAYDGFIWCPVALPNGTWLARRNGTVYWTGNSDQVNKIKDSMGLNKKSRDEAANDGNFAAWLADLKARAKIFGVHRQRQLTKALSLFEELSTVVGTFDRSDDEERRKIGFPDEASIVDWVRTTALPEYRVLDEFFRQHEQMYWVRDL